MNYIVLVSKMQANPIQDFLEGKRGRQNHQLSSLSLSLSLCFVFFFFCFVFLQTMTFVCCSVEPTRPCGTDIFQLTTIRGHLWSIFSCLHDAKTLAWNTAQFEEIDPFFPFLNCAGSTAWHDRNKVKNVKQIFGLVLWGQFSLTHLLRLLGADGGTKYIYLLFKQHWIRPESGQASTKFFEKLQLTTAAKKLISFQPRTYLSRRLLSVSVAVAASTKRLTLNPAHLVRCFYTHAQREQPISARQTACVSPHSVTPSQRKRPVAHWSLHTQRFFWSHCAKWEQMLPFSSCWLFCFSSFSFVRVDKWM